MDPFRILITGSRDWTDRDQIRKSILGWAAHARSQGRPVVVVHGACPTGADKLASDFVSLTLIAWMDGITEERHPADWKAHGNYAGLLRNLEMVCLGADVCLAFLAPCRQAGCPRKGLHGSHGAEHCSDKAEEAGIRTERWYDHGTVTALATSKADETQDRWWRPRRRPARLPRPPGRDPA